MTTEWMTVDTASVNESPDPARWHEGGQIDCLRASIETFGFTLPVVIDRRGTVIDGNARLRVARALGIERIPAVQVGWKPADLRMYRMIAHAALDQGMWNIELLRAALSRHGAQLGGGRRIGFVDAKCPKTRRPALAPGRVKERGSRRIADLRYGGRFWITPTIRRSTLRLGCSNTARRSRPS